MLLVPFAFGLILTIGSILGCCFTKPGNMCFLGLYAVIQFVSGSLIIISGAFIVTTISKYFKNITTTENISDGLAEGVGGAQQDFSDFLLGLYSGCCNGSSTVIPMCPERLPQPPNLTFCFLDQTLFENGVTAGQLSFTTYCSYRPLEQACADESIRQFLEANYNWLKDNVLPVGITFLVFGSLLFLASCCSCRVGCMKDEDEEEKQPPRQAQQQGTGQPKPAEEGIQHS